jgi:hypothetical protein
MFDFAPRLWARTVAAVLLLLGCGDGVGSTSDAGTHAANKTRHVKLRTVRVELLRVAERMISKGPNGELVWGTLTDLEDVKVCLWKKRPLLGRFEDFVDVDGPCDTSGPDGRVPPFEGLPANSELIFRWTKEGFEPLATHFVTYEQNFVPPTLLSGARVAMLRVGAADPWLEPLGAPGDGDGVAAVHAMIGGLTGGKPIVTGLQLGVGPITGVTTAEGIEVTLVPERGGATGSVVKTRKDRPSWLVLPEGEYKVTFNHPPASCWWFAEQILMPASGYPTDETGVVRVPVFAGHSVTLAADCTCDPAHELGTPTDVASCSFAPDAGM